MSQEVRACGRATFARLLVREGMGEPEAAAMLGRFAPFFSAADGGCYPLSPAPSIDPDVVAAAIGAAVGRPVTTLCPVSVAALLALPGRGSRATALRAAGANLRHGVWLSLLFGRSDALTATLGMQRRLALAHAFGEAVGWRLRAAFDTTVSRALGEDLTLHAWNSLEETLVYHLGFALAGDAAGADLLPLVATLPHAVPLCPAPGNSGTWLVLVR